jgi:hypothetical protein
VSRTSITRLSRKASSDRATLDRLLDSVHIGHFAIVADEVHPVVPPTQTGFSSGSEHDQEPRAASDDCGFRAG